MQSIRMMEPINALLVLDQLPTLAATKVAGVMRTDAANSTNAIIKSNGSNGSNGESMEANGSTGESVEANGSNGESMETIEQINTSLILDQFVILAAADSG